MAPTPEFPTANSSWWSWWLDGNSRVRSVCDVQYFGSSGGNVPRQNAKDGLVVLKAKYPKDIYNEDTKGVFLAARCSCNPPRCRRSWWFGSDDRSRPSTPEMYNGFTMRCSKATNGNSGYSNTPRSACVSMPDRRGSPPNICIGCSHIWTQRVSRRLVRHQRGEPLPFR